MEQQIERERNAHEPDYSWLEERVFGRALDAAEREVLRSMQILHFANWQSIVRQGQPGDALYILRSGSVGIEDINGGDRVKLASVGEGAFFGEMSFFSRKETTAEVVAASPCIVYRIDRDCFSHIMSQQSDLAYDLLARLLAHQASIIREMNSQMLPILRAIKEKAERLPLAIKLFPLLFIIAYIAAFAYISIKDFHYGH